MWDFREQFSTEQRCLEYLILCKWPEGFKCPHCCGSTYTVLSTRKSIQCKSCRRQLSPMAQTVMHWSHIPIKKWFEAAYWIANHTPGMSALQLQKHLGIGSYDSAWHMLHRLRKGMVNDERTKLSGLIETDETIIGGPAKGKKGRGVTASENKSLVVGAVEILVYQSNSGKKKERTGRLRLALIPDASEDTLGDFLEENAETGSRIRTDGWPGYSEAALIDFIHHVRVIGKEQIAHKRLPHIHRAFGNLKTWLNGTHHGVDPKHLQSYLDEYTFRYNRRQTPMAAFQSLLSISLKRGPLPLTELASAASTW
ncbi:MAG TPA: IS1595 family transposase [Nitrospirae bacterium]|nr:ISXO2-like transposase domain protein [bacterium BMS3Abin06]HDH12620.1 IS1595 family transposase [Nitrospirota bacterium]HDZ00105.1 IS1595 family transposase [Nitrospirota bacterium]